VAVRTVRHDIGKSVPLTVGSLRASGGSGGGAFFGNGAGRLGGGLLAVTLGDELGGGDWYVA
jgi:hypothetical protein